MAELTKEVHEAEGHDYASLAAEIPEDGILHVEGFHVALWPNVGADGSSWPQVGFPELPEYPYKRRAPNRWTYKEWVLKRLKPIMADGNITVEVWMPDNADMTLGELRA